MNETLRRELLAMQSEDEGLREELQSEGSLENGYHAELEAMHEKHAARLEAIVGEHGWPGIALVGERGATAAWLVAQHAVGEPALMRRALKLMALAATRNDIPRWQLAMLTDRICLFEGKPQRYGTQFDWDENGELNPFPEIENPEEVDGRRAEVGLGPLEQDIARHRAEADAVGDAPPPDVKEHRREMNNWARSVGWRTG